MKQYEDSINKILEGVAPQIEECGAKIAAAEAAVSQSDKDMNEALRSGDDVAYMAAKEKKEKAEASLNAVSARMDFLKKGPLISAEEYESMVSGILGEMNEANDRDKREAVKLCEKLLVIIDRNLNMIEEGNALLHRLQFDVYRGADIPKRPDGEFVLDYFGRRDKQFFDRNPLFGWGYYALKNCVQYTALRDSVREKS